MLFALISFVVLRIKYLTSFIFYLFLPRLLLRFLGLSSSNRSLSDHFKMGETSDSFSTTTERDACDSKRSHSIPGSPQHENQHHHHHHHYHSVSYSESPYEENGAASVTVEDTRPWAVLKRSLSTRALSLPVVHHVNKWINSVQWIPTSFEALDLAEKKLLSNVKSNVRFGYVPIWHKRFQMWAAVFEQHRHPQPASSRQQVASSNSKGTPIVMLHGFGGGLGLWMKNLDELCEGRTVYAVDLLGFGKSSRPKFSNDVATVENEFVSAIEDFRREAKLDKMILLGHSLGGYLATAYAMHHPDRVRHLILADPWGFTVKSDENERTVQIPGWVKTMAALSSVFTPLALLRASGPYGPNLLRKIRADFSRKFNDNETVFDYIYHCNAQTPPSGEAAFKVLSLPYGWAKRPMLERMKQLREDVPITFIYGSRSWVDCQPGYEIQREIRTESHVRVEVISAAGHHVYADQSEVFNTLVNEVCETVDLDQDKPFLVQECL